MNEVAFQFLREQREKSGHTKPPLGQMLLEEGAVTVGQLLPALGLHKRLGVVLGQVLISEGVISEKRLYDTLARQWDLPRAHLEPRGFLDQIDGIDGRFCIKHGVFPERFENGLLRLAVSNRDSFTEAKIALKDHYGVITASVASRSEIREAINICYADELAHSAATQLPEADSCRAMSKAALARYFAAAFVIISFFSTLYFAPSQMIFGLTVFAIALMLGASVLKGAAMVAALLPRKRTHCNKQPSPQPVVSVIVPLHRESNIAETLIKRLSRLTYPKPLLDVLLVVEEQDDATQASLANAELPSWMSVLKVPEGQPKTKPRALNHALPFCRGEVVGIYDAEDLPERDQIEKVVETFQSAPPNVACVQGVLQFYNHSQNWLARCFSMEYGAWFRVLLPGLSRMGLPVPLGGTTLFLKRAAIESLSGWDAHNVTEDADLGMRLHRRGFRTILMPSLTEEEATSHLWAWIRQRSRWIKGFQVTYWTHMRRPLKLLRDLGPLQFLSFQILFLIASLNFIVAPVLIALYMSMAGLPHPYFTQIGEPLSHISVAGFLASECLQIGIIALALKRAGRLHLAPWIPTVSLYFLLSIPAGIKAAIEFVVAPVYWDKTDHGHSLTKTD